MNYQSLPIVLFEITNEETGEKTSFQTFEDADDSLNRMRIETGQPHTMSALIDA